MVLDQTLVAGDRQHRGEVVNRMVRTAYKHLFVAGILSVAVMGVGCGSSSSSPDDDGPSSSSSTSHRRETKARTYKSRVRTCLEGVGYEVSEAGNATRVQSPGGRRIANIQFFKTEAQAKRFYKRLLVDGAGGGKAVAIYLEGGSDSDRAVVGDCLTP